MQILFWKFNSENSVSFLDKSSWFSCLMIENKLILNVSKTGTVNSFLCKLIIASQINFNKTKSLINTVAYYLIFQLKDLKFYHHNGLIMLIIFLNFRSGRIVHFWDNEFAIKFLHVTEGWETNIRFFWNLQNIL